MNSTWIVVAHRAGARIFEHSFGTVRLLREIEHEGGRRKSGDIDSDRQGRSFDRPPGLGRHALSTNETPHDHDAKAFANALADTLRTGRNEHRFARLALVAEPRFLGMLRGALDDATAATVGGSLGKDLANVESRDIADHVREVLSV